MPTLSCVYEPLRKPQGDPEIHIRTNCVGQFGCWEAKVKIWFTDGAVLWQSESTSYGGENAEVINY